MDVLIGLFEEECASGMVQRRQKRNAIVQGVQTMLLKEEFAIRMGRRSHANYAAMKDVQIMPRMEGCVLNMGQRSSDAAAKDAPILS